MSPPSITKGKKKPVVRLRYWTTMVGILAFMFVYLIIGSWKLSKELLVTSSDAATAIQHHPPCRNPPPTNFEFLCQDPAVHFLKITSPPIQKPKILCLVLTQSANHATRMQAVVDTWGRKCDILIGASNATDAALHTYHIESRGGYWGIWDKLLQTLKQILQGQLGGAQDFDWILKADDDTYVIMENLQSFLANISHDNLNQKEPRIYGRTMAWPRLKRFQDMTGWFGDTLNRDFGKRFYSKLSVDETLRFSHGGPGYIMNRAYAQLLVDAYFDTSGNAIKGEVAEDIANAVTMLYHGIRPRSTFDLDTGKERMHPESPQTMYQDPIWMERMHHGMKASVHGPGEKCCSPTSISYHYVADFQMRLLDYQLYHCPRSSM